MDGGHWVDGNNFTSFLTAVKMQPFWLRFHSMWLKRKCANVDELNFNMTSPHF